MTAMSPLILFHVECPDVIHRIGDWSLEAKARTVGLGALESEQGLGDWGSKLYTEQRLQASFRETRCWCGPSTQSWYWLERRLIARRLRTGQTPGSTLGPLGTGGPNFATETVPRGLKHGVELGKCAFNNFFFNMEIVHSLGFEHQIALYEELSIFTLPPPRRKHFQQFELYSPLNFTSLLIYLMLLPSYFFSELLYLYICLLFIDMIDFTKFFKMIEIFVWFLNLLCGLTFQVSFLSQTFSSFSFIT